MFLLARKNKATQIRHRLATMQSENSTGNKNQNLGTTTELKREFVKKTYEHLALFPYTN